MRKLVSRWYLTDRGSVRRRARRTRAPLHHLASHWDCFLPDDAKNSALRASLAWGMERLPARRGFARTSPRASRAFEVRRASNLAPAWRGSDAWLRDRIWAFVSSPSPCHYSGRVVAVAAPSNAVGTTSRGRAG